VAYGFEGAVTDAGSRSLGVGKARTLATLLRG